MAKLFEEITPALQAWLMQQRMFFVASAPLSATGHVNCSPKGLDSFRVLDRRTVAYLDLTGSGIETVSHVRENSRIVFMFCAFEGPPKIVRLHARGEVITPDHQHWAELRALFPDVPGARAIVRASVHRIGDSCGYAVPFYNFVSERDALVRVTNNKGPQGMRKLREETNMHSIDGLTGLERNP